MPAFEWGPISAEEWLGRAGSVGRPFDTVELMVVDDNDRVADDGRPGTFRPLGRTAERDSRVPGVGSSLDSLEADADLALDDPADPTDPADPADPTDPTDPTDKAAPLSDPYLGYGI